MGKKIQIHIADDHKILIEGIYAVIETSTEIEIEGFSLTGEEVIEWYKHNCEHNIVDVLILDINMPLLDGVGVLKFLKNQPMTKMKVIILSGYDDVNLVRELIQLGASGFLSKNNASQHIIDAVKIVHSGEQFFDTDIKDNLLRLFIGNGVMKGDRPESLISQNLTKRELEVLKLISSEYNSTEIATMLNLSKSTVETYRKKLFKKIKAKNAVGLVKYAIKYNLMKL